MEGRMSCLRILATTDFHGNIEAIRKTAQKARLLDADVIIACGDITHFGTLKTARQLLTFLTEAHVPILFVPGNCDPPTLADEKTETMESIHGKCKQVDNINFIGIGGSSPSPFNTPFELQETQIATILKQVHKACPTNGSTVLVSHSPPRDTKVDVAFTGEHVGSHSVREFVEKTRPSLLICGHIHEAKGVDKIGTTFVVNPGPARHGNCALITTNTDINIEFDNL